MNTGILLPCYSIITFTGSIQLVEESKNFISSSLGPKVNNIHVVNHWFSTKNEFLPREHLAITRWWWEGNTGILQAEVRDTAKHLRMYGTTPPQKNNDSVLWLKNPAIDYLQLQSYLTKKLRRRSVQYCIMNMNIILYTISICFLP